MKNNQAYTYRIAKRLIVFLLLLLYVFSYFSFKLVHQLQHSHEYEALHTEENENEACHRAVFHFEKDACNHKTHITSLEKHCDLCDIIVQQNRLELRLQIPGTQLGFTESNFELKQILFSPDQLTRQSRAPPISI